MLNEWDGKVAGNGPGGRGRPNFSHRYDWECFHNLLDHAPEPPPTEPNSKINVTDTTECVRALHHDRLGFARAAVRKALDTNRCLVLYDAWGYDLDRQILPMLAVIREEIQRGTGAVVPVGGGGNDDQVPVTALTWIRGNESDAARFTRTARLFDVHVSADTNEISWDCEGIEGWPKGSIDDASGNIITAVEVAPGRWLGSAWEWIGAGSRAKVVEGRRGLPWALTNGGADQAAYAELRGATIRRVAIMLCSVVRGRQRTVDQRTNIVVVEVG
jgi:hypothetical protein